MKSQAGRVSNPSDRLRDAPRVSPPIESVENPRPSMERPRKKKVIFNISNRLRVGLGDSPPIENVENHLSAGTGTAYDKSPGRQ